MADGRPLWWRWARALFGLAIVAYAVRFVLANWETVRASPLEWRVRPLLVLASLATILATYALLAETWRRVVAAWGTRLPPWVGARVWVLSSMGKYLPGKIWAVAGMAALGKRAGVAPAVATASAVVLQLLSIGSGAAIVALSGFRELERARPGIAAALVLVLAISGASLLLVLRPRLLNAVIRRLVGEGHTLPGPPPLGVLAGAVVSNGLAWVFYGAALYWLAHGVLADTALDATTAVRAFTGSYLAGFLFLLAPGGLVVRESVFVLLTQAALGPTEALALAAVSRVGMTLADLLAAAPFVLHRGSPSDTP